MVQLSQRSLQTREIPGSNAVFDIFKSKRNPLLIFLDSQTKTFVYTYTFGCFKEGMLKKKSKESNFQTKPIDTQRKIDDEDSLGFAFISFAFVFRSTSLNTCRWCRDFESYEAVTQ